MIPKPKLPKLDLDEEIDSFEEEMDTASEEEEKGRLGREKLANSFSKLFGFVAAIGLPQEIMAQKIQYYSQLADETGVTEALIDTIEYYFPETEMSPAIALAVTGIAFASAVISDRMQIKKRYEQKKKLEGKPTAKQVKEQQERKKEGVKVE